MIIKILRKKRSWLADTNEELRKGNAGLSYAYMKLKIGRD